jgi:D-glycero-D-manno-heptose 1,7-bisphosphate phosphatase
MLSWIGNLETTTASFLFLDRDGVFNVDRPDYVKNWEEFQFYPDTLPALRWLYQHRVAVIVISNQSALHRGYMGWDRFWDLHHNMIDAVRRAGANILAAYYCPHRPDEHCACRKPSPGMLLSAARTFGVVPASTAMIGDRPTDLLTARAAGCRAILLDRAGGQAGDRKPVDVHSSVPDGHFTSLLEAVQALF